jgi:outer membrane protein assembly factor BamA
MLQRGVLASLLVLSFLCAKAQDADTTRKNTLFPIPIGFYTPETRWGIGAAGVYNFYIDKSDTISPPSQLQGGLAVTQERQFLAYLPFSVFWNERKWFSFGELGYYRYNYFFYGVGNNPENREERYDVDFSRFRFNLFRKVYKRWYVGARVWVEDWKFTGFEEGGALADGSVSGNEGGLTVDPGLLLLHDGRDNVLYPTRGWLIEAVTQHATGAFGWSRYRLDVRNYMPLHNDITWANQLFTDVTTGTTPFYMMAMLGGTKRMRGYYEGRFRDKTGVLYQTEVRARIWRRWGATAFWSAGIVDATAQQWSLGNLRNAGGLGIRFELDPEKDLNIRLDVATGPGSSQFYLTVGEAF